MRESERERFDDDEARGILARAIELDARTPVTTRADILEIANELGVSTAAVDAALREHAAATVPTTGAPRAHRTATTIAALGVPIGFAAGAALATLPALTSVLVLRGIMGVGLVASGALLVAQGSNATLRSFNARNLVLWSGVIAGSLAGMAVLGVGGAVPMPWLYTVAGAIQNWLAATVLGSAAVLAIRRSRRGSGLDNGDSPATGAASGAGRMLRFARRALRWLDERRAALTRRLSVLRPDAAGDGGARGQTDFAYQAFRRA